MTTDSVQRKKLHKMYSSFFVISSIIITFYPVTSIASCNPKDFPLQDTDISQTFSSYRYSYLERMSEKEFSERKMGGQISNIIPGVTLPNSISFEDFKRSVREEKKSLDINISDDQFASMYRLYGSDSGVRAYEACLNSQGAKLSISAPISAMNSEEFHLTVTWRGPVRNGQGSFDMQGSSLLSILGGSIINEEFWNKQIKIDSGQTVRIPVRRDLCRNFQVAASVNGESAELFLPRRTPERSNNEYEVVSSEAITSYCGFSNGYTEQEHSACVRASGKELLLYSTARVIDDKIHVSGGKPRYSSNIIESKASKDRIICFANRARVGDHQSGAAITSHLEVVKIKTSPLQLDFCKR